MVFNTLKIGMIVFIRECDGYFYLGQVEQIGEKRTVMETIPAYLIQPVSIIKPKEWVSIDNLYTIAEIRSKRKF